MMVELFSYHAIAHANLHGQLLSLLGWVDINQDAVQRDRHPLTHRGMNCLSRVP